MIGKSILHYKILSKLGEGGMGVVYQAQDTKLDREVAIKFLPRQIAASAEERERFKIEAKAAAALNHANIATIYAIEEADAETFIAMELITGRELKDLIEAGPLPVVQTLDIATQIAQGMQIAHEAGVVHRDIKSTNIMLTDRGEVKIMDFGLAKRGGEAKLTQEGTTLGTVAYMSPEQTRGGEVDGRSDLFSIGVLIYEMLTGQLPFKGDYDQAVTYSILNEDPEPVTAVRSGIPMELERIVNKCLEKNAADRYPRADDLIIDLRKLAKGLEQEATPSVAASSVKSSIAAAPAQSQPVEEESKHRTRWLRPAVLTGVLLVVAIAIFMLTGRDVATSDSERIMLAVLPFENRGSPEDEYFADGISEEITSRLSGIGQLGVIASASASKYKGSEKSIAEIGGELGVEYLLVGTVRWEKQADAESRVRVTPQLIKVADETNLWSKPYDAVLSDVFQIQSDISEQAAQALQIRLLESEGIALRAKPTENIEAYDYFLRGYDYLKQSYLGERKERMQIAQTFLEKAVALDANFTQAHALLSTTHSRMYWYFHDRTPARLLMAKEAVDKALSLDPESSEALSALGRYHYWGHLDYESAVDAFTRVLDVEPNHIEALSGIAYVRRRQGYFDQTIDYLMQALTYDPRNTEFVYSVGETYSLMRQYDLARDYLDRVRDVNPDQLRAHIHQAVNFNRWGKPIMAMAALEEAASLAEFETSPATNYHYIHTLILNGKQNNALQHLIQITMTDVNSQFYLIPGQLVYAYLYELTNQPQRARSYYDSTRVILENRLKEEPQDERIHSALGITYAGLGLKAEAIKAGTRATELLPISKEAYKGAFRLSDLAQIYATVGEHDKAIDLLEQLLSVPSPLSVGLLKLDPVWRPLQDKPRFQAILRKYGG